MANSGHMPLASEKYMRTSQKATLPDFSDAGFASDFGMIDFTAPAPAPAPEPAKTQLPLAASIQSNANRNMGLTAFLERTNLQKFEAALNDLGVEVIFYSVFNKYDAESPLTPLYLTGRK
jgi:hypothetical protein